MNDMWFEKYRPQTIEDYVCDDRTKSIINNTLKQQTHLLLHGGAGSGKTTLCKILLNEVGHKSDTMVINASDENSVDVVRHKIMTFVSSMGWSKDVRNGVKKKIVLLDEFDYMSQESQAILRGILEKHTDRVMFLLTCNYINKVISPIQSRCFTRRLKTPPIQLIKDRCEYILQQENVSYDERNLNSLINITYPDFRLVINILQNHCVDNVLEEVDVTEYPSDRVTLLNRMIYLFEKCEYNLDFKFKLTEKEQQELKQLMCDSDFLVTKQKEVFCEE